MKKPQSSEISIFFACCILVAMLLSLGKCHAQCPDYGDATSARLQNLNTLKNRDIAAGVVDGTVTLRKILQDGYDTGRFNNDQFVIITGWCVLAKWGGPEGCNCHSKNKDDWDIHLVISTDSDQTDQDSCMIVEITRKFRATHGGLTPKSFVHKKLEVIGDMFRDDEHTRNSVNDADEGTTDLFRKTPWEIHPVIMVITLK